MQLPHHLLFCFSVVYFSVMYFSVGYFSGRQAYLIRHCMAFFRDHFKIRHRFSNLQTKANDWITTCLEFESQIGIMLFSIFFISIVFLRRKHNKTCLFSVGLGRNQHKFCENLPYRRMHFCLAKSLIILIWMGESPDANVTVPRIFPRDWSLLVSTADIDIMKKKSFKKFIFKWFRYVLKFCKHSFIA